MGKILADTYDKIYSAHESGYGNRPLPTVEMAVRYLSPGSKVLDIGAGRGRHALPLAESGFQVEAVDLSEVGIRQIIAIAEARNLPLRAQVADIIRTGITDTYDLIICTFVHHHLTKQEGQTLLSMLKEHTKPQGLNVVSGFTKHGDYYNWESDPEEWYYFNLEELPQFYSDWEVIYYGEHLGTASQDIAYNISAHLLAQNHFNTDGYTRRYFHFCGTLAVPARPRICADVATNSRSEEEGKPGLRHYTSRKRLPRSFCSLAMTADLFQ